MVRQLARLDDAEPVAVGVGEHDVVGIRFVVPVDAGRTDADQPLDLLGLVEGVQVEVMTLVGAGFRRDLGDRKLRPVTSGAAPGWPSHPTARRRAAGSRGLPTRTGWPKARRAHPTRPNRPAACPQYPPDQGRAKPSHAALGQRSMPGVAFAHGRLAGSIHLVGSPRRRNARDRMPRRSHQGPVPQGTLRGSLLIDAQARSGSR